MCACVVDSSSSATPRHQQHNESSLISVQLSVIISNTLSHHHQHRTTQHQSQAVIFGRQLHQSPLFVQPSTECQHQSSLVTTVNTESQRQPQLESRNHPASVTTINIHQQRVISISHQAVVITHQPSGSSHHSHITLSHG